MGVVGEVVDRTIVFDPRFENRLVQLLGQRNQVGGKALSAGRLCVIDIAALYRLGVFDRVFLGCVYTMISTSFGHLADWAHVMRVKGIQQQLLGALQLMSKDQSNQLTRLPSHVALAELLSTTRESVARTALVFIFSRPSSVLVVEMCVGGGCTNAYRCVGRRDRGSGRRSG